MSDQHMPCLLLLVSFHISSKLSDNLLFSRALNYDFAYFVTIWAFYVFQVINEKLDNKRGAISRLRMVKNWYKGWNHNFGHGWVTDGEINIINGFKSPENLRNEKKMVKMHSNCIYKEPK